MRNYNDDKENEILSENQRIVHACYIRIELTRVHALCMCYVAGSW